MTSETSVKYYRGNLEENDPNMYLLVSKGGILLGGYWGSSGEDTLYIAGEPINYMAGPLMDAVSYHSGLESVQEYFRQANEGYGGECKIITVPHIMYPDPETGLDAVELNRAATEWLTTHADLQAEPGRIPTTPIGTLIPRMLLAVIGKNR